MRLFVSLAFLTLSLSAGVYSQATDINGDGVLNGSDVNSLIEALLGVGPASPEHDVTKDGRVDIGDLVVANTEFYANPMIPVAAATFTMGNSWVNVRDEIPVHQVTLSPYEIGRFEVTNAEYAQFLNSSLASGEIEVSVGVVHLPGNDTDPLFFTAEADDHMLISQGSGVFTVFPRESQSMLDHPVTGVTWHGAAAYCNWLSRHHGYEVVYSESGDWVGDLTRDGYHLPTEAQWERAAAWDADEGRQWRYAIQSDQIDHSVANYSRNPAAYDSANPVGFSEMPYTSPVGHFRKSISDVGCFDMTGNVYEVCHDWYGGDYYSISPSHDPEGPGVTELRTRVARGGGWYSDHNVSQTVHRFIYGIRPGWHDDDLGFRLARNL